MAARLAAKLAQLVARPGDLVLHRQAAAGERLPAPVRIIPVASHSSSVAPRLASSPRMLRLNAGRETPR